jgi:uncharacterized protein (DUF362 family)
MPGRTTRRQFLVQTGVAATSVVVGTAKAIAPPTSRPARPKSRVIIARDEALTRGAVDEHRDLLRKLLDASLQKLTQSSDAAAAWRGLFKPTDRVGIKVNTLGLSTQPAVVDAIVAGLRTAGVPAENIVIWDRFDVELAQAGFKLNKSAGGPKCRGTDAEHYGSGYLPDIETSGRIGSCFSRILAEDVSALICVPVLKDHNLAGVSLGLKNWFGAIHNPNKYHDRNCDPYIVDVVAHKYIRPRWRLTICDGTRAQYNAGPQRHPAYAWSYGGLLVGTDVVAVDAVAADLVEQQRKAKGLRPLAAEKRPPVHIATAGARGFGEADLAKIERGEV